MTHGTSQLPPQKLKIKIELSREDLVKNRIIQAFFSVGVNPHDIHRRSTGFQKIVYRNTVNLD